MLSPNLIILYVKDAVASGDFYRDLFKRDPAFAAPSFVSFQFDNGVGFGLWSESADDFTVGGTGNRSEIAFIVPNPAAVDATHAEWVKAGIAIEQPPFDAVFGRTFVGLDPDGHRIRVCLADE